MFFFNLVKNFYYFVSFFNNFFYYIFLVWNMYFFQRLIIDVFVLVDEFEVIWQYLVVGGIVMRVEQNNFRDMFFVYFFGLLQMQYVFCVFLVVWVVYMGLVGEEWLKVFLLQIFQYGDGGDICIVFIVGGMLVFFKNIGYIVYQFFVCQWMVMVYLVCIIKMIGQLYNLFFIGG